MEIVQKNKDSFIVLYVTPYKDDRIIYIHVKTNKVFILNGKEDECYDANGRLFVSKGVLSIDFKDLNSAIEFSKNYLKGNNDKYSIQVAKEFFFNLADIREFLLLHPDQDMIKAACLHYLGDEHQKLDERNKTSKDQDSPV